MLGDVRATVLIACSLLQKHAGRAMGRVGVRCLSGEKKKKHYGFDPSSVGSSHSVNRAQITQNNKLLTPKVIKTQHPADLLPQMNFSVSVVPVC